MLILNILTFFHLFIFFIILFFRKNNSLPNKILALILINPAINFISNANTLLGNLEALPEVYFFAQFTCLLFGPLVFFYICLLTGHKVKIWHPAFILTSLSLLLHIYFYFEFKFMSVELQKAYLDGILNEPYPEQMNIINGIFILLQLVYFTLGGIRVYKYNKSYKNFFSSQESTQSTYLTLFISLIWTLNFITIFAYIMLQPTTVEYIVLPVVLVLIYSFIMYYIFKHNSVFTRASYLVFKTNHEVIEESNIQREDDKKNIASSELDDQLEIKISEAITSQNFHTNMGCTLKDLSKLIDCHPHKISQHLKLHHQKNFNQFINQHRVEFAKQLLNEKRNWTVEAIAFEAGFNSRASFYRVFKEEVGISPTSYINSL